MINEISSFKKKFNRSLEPIKVMLVSRKDVLNEKDWEAFVLRTEESIIRNPDQYLGKDLPKPEFLEAIVKEIFMEFVRHENPA